MSRKLLTTPEAAQVLNVSPAFLERDRWAGARIPFIKLSARTVRYAPEALDEYLASRTRLSTSDDGGRNG